MHKIQFNMQAIIYFGTCISLLTPFIYSTCYHIFTKLPSILHLDVNCIFFNNIIRLVPSQNF